jgi:hypothetical protein
MATGRNFYMSKMILTEDGYIAELNMQLKHDEYYEESMEFIPYPDGATGHQISGYSINGSFNKIGVFALVAYEVSKKFDIRLK